MAGAGSDQRGLQYEQTLVSWTGWSQFVQTRLFHKPTRSQVWAKSFNLGKSTRVRVAHVCQINRHGSVVVDDVMDHCGLAN